MLHVIAAKLHFLITAEAVPLFLAPLTLPADNKVYLNKLAELANVKKNKKKKIPKTPKWFKCYTYGLMKALNVN